MIVRMFMLNQRTAEKVSITLKVSNTPEKILFIYFFFITTHFINNFPTSSRNSERSHISLIEINSVHTLYS